MTDFEVIWPKLKQALDRHGPTHTKSDVRELIESGVATVWQRKHAIIVTIERQHSTGFRTLSGWLTHGRFPAIVSLWREIEAFAKQGGFHRIQLLGPKGWKRPLPDYSETCVMLTKDLHDVL